MKYLIALVLVFASHSFGGGYETDTKLNSVEWDNDSHAIYAWIDNSTSGQYDKLYMYDWTLSGNSIEKAGAIYATMLAAYTSGFPVLLYYSVKAAPSLSGWGTIGVMAAVRLGNPQAP